MLFKFILTSRSPANHHSGICIKQQLKIASIHIGTSYSQAKGIVCALEEWGLAEKVFATG